MPVRHAVPAVALLIGLVGIPLLSGCTPEPELVGQMGITANADGRPVLVLATCGGAIDDVTLSHLPYGKRSDGSMLGEWRTDASIHGTSRLDVGKPVAPWSGPRVTTEPGPHYIAMASSSENDTDALNDLTFRGRQIPALDPTKVYTNSDDPDSDALVAHPAAKFHDWACAA